MVASQTGSLVKGMALGALYGAYEPANAIADLCGTGVHQVSYIYTGAGNAKPDYEYCNYLIQVRHQRWRCHASRLQYDGGTFLQRRAEGMRLVNFDPHMSAGCRSG